MSTHTPGCPQRELAVGWALHCLEPAEEAVFTGHLPGCDDCRRTVEQTEEVGVSLAMAVPDVAPPAELEERVRRISATAPPGAAPVVPLRRRPSAAGRSSRAARVLTAAAAVTLVAVSAGLGVRVSQLDAERDQLAGQASALSEVVDRAANPAAERISLLQTDGTPVAMVLAAPDQLTLVPVGLPANRTGSQVYVLWGQGSGAPVALAAFDVAADAPAVHTVSSMPQGEAFTAYAVSLEPGRTPPSTPSDVMASGQVES
ncbi:MAG: anti-sigma factor domain-containing protein [Pseudonocardiaceae bacterium]